MGIHTVFRSGAKRCFAEDYQVPQRLFCMVVSWWNSGITKKSKQGRLSRSDQKLPQVFAALEFQRLFADAAKGFDELFFNATSFGPGNLPDFQFFGGLAGS